jgi:hypothetical protein
MITAKDFQGTIWSEFFHKRPFERLGILKDIQGLPTISDETLIDENRVFMMPTGLSLQRWLKPKKRCSSLRVSFVHL